MSPLWSHYYLRQKWQVIPPCVLGCIQYISTHHLLVTKSCIMLKTWELDEQWPRRFNNPMSCAEPVKCQTATTRKHCFGMSHHPLVVRVLRPWQRDTILLLSPKVTSTIRQFIVWWLYWHVRKPCNSLKIKSSVSEVENPGHYTVFRSVVLGGRESFGDIWCP